MISEAGDHQCAGGQLPAQAFVDQEGADGAVREPVLELAGARHLLVFDDLPRLAGKFGDARLALSFGGQRAVAFGLLHPRSEEHTSELQSLMRISYAVFCLKKKYTSLMRAYLRTPTSNTLQI